MIRPLRRLCICAHLWHAPAQRARLSLHFWKRFQYDYYGWGHSHDGEIGAGYWADWCHVGSVAGKLGPGEHALPSVPALRAVDRTRSIEEDDAERRRLRRDAVEAPAMQPMIWNAHIPHDSTAYAMDDSGVDESSFDWQHIEPSSSIDYAAVFHDDGGIGSSEPSWAAAGFTTDEDAVSVGSLYSQDDFKPPSARYMTSTPGGLHRSGARAAVAVASYTAKDDTELSFSTGDVVCAVNCCACACAY